mgnify:CR=1 FL=1
MGHALAVVDLLDRGGALVVWALVSAVGGDRSKEPPRQPERETAEEALRRRYADGEIDEEEYRERLRVLRDESDDDV